MRISTACLACRYEAYSIRLAIVRRVWAIVGPTPPEVSVRNRLTFLFISSRRRKCETPEFGTSCTYCSNRGIRCTRDAQAVSRPSRVRPDVATQKPLVPSEAISQDGLILKPSSPLPPLSICLELVQLYFDYIHDQFHSLFHRPSVIQDVECGHAPPALVLAMMALSARSI